MSRRSQPERRICRWRPRSAVVSGAVQDGIGHYQLSTRNAQRSSASSAFVKPVQGRKNLTVRLDAQTLKVGVQNGRAVGITVASGSGTETLNADREVIISCGAIGSPRLLQISGIGPANSLRAAGVPVVHDLPGVGSPRWTAMEIAEVPARLW